MKGRILPICIFLVSIFWVYKGWFQYSFWQNNGPGGGFLVVVVGLLCAVFSLFEIIKADKASEAVTLRNLLPVLAIILLIASTMILGMVLSLGLLMFLWLVVIEKYSIVKATVYGVCTVGFTYVVFNVLFKIPFPTGILGI